MDKKRMPISAMKTNVGMVDDNSAWDELNANFSSEVYQSVDELLTDMYVIGKNEDFKRTLVGEPGDESNRRSHDERQELLIAKIRAERRYESHIENGGTNIEFGNVFAGQKNTSH
ncbi:hypothetical protein [Vibrio sp. WXL103]|uniref:hypothetical protein n=1 Tax=Vibrio sp. WXL103 TaxID=3450710 RepID=UPI003EC64874